MDGEGRDTVQLIGAQVTFIPMDEGSVYSIVEWDVEPGTKGPPIHIHHETDEGFYVTDGWFGFVRDGVTTYAKAGTHVTVPRGHPHSFWNAGVRAARCLCVISPPGFEQYFRELAAQLGGVDSQEGALELRKRLSERFDMEVVGPPAGPEPEADRR